MKDAPIRVEIGRIARIVLARPDKHNAMTAGMADLAAEAVERINASGEPRVVLVEGEGRAFSAGGDFDVIEQNAGRAPEENRVNMLRFYRRFLSVLSLRAPSIAVVHGAAVGAGLCLAMACDMRLAAAEAKLGANFVRVGLHPGMGCTALLPRLVGPAKAAELILTGKLIRGDEAERIGLVQKAVPRADLPALVDETVAAITSAAPIAVAQAKATLSAGLMREVDDALAREAGAQAIDFTTGDLRRAIAAFRAGAEPEFKGE